MDSNHDTQIQGLKSCLLDEEGIMTQLDSLGLEINPGLSVPSLRAQAVAWTGSG